jgi:hypothetical protein
MSPVLARPRPQSPPHFRRQFAVVIVAGAIVIAALGGVYAAIRGPDFVDRVTIVNDTPYLVDVEVTNGPRDGWLRLGPISPGESHDFGSVVDQGGRWIFHVTTGPHDGGEFAQTKRELEEGHWRITIPADVQRRLEGSGAAPIRPPS